MNKDIAFATYDWSMGVTPIEPNGCAWYRCELPRRELEKHGWEARIGHPQYFTNNSFGITSVNKDEMSYGYSIIVFKLIMLKQILDIMRNNDRDTSQKIIVDIDDFYEGLTEHNLAWRNTDPSRSEESNREHYLDIIEEADYLTVSTQFLYDYYTKEKGKTNVFLVRNAIDIDRWRKRNDHSRYLPTVGWVGATPWRSLDLEQLQPFFGEFMSKNRLPFHHAGHINGHSVVPKLGLNSDTKFTHEPRKIISQYPEMFRKIDIGLVPLNNIPFNHAKSSIKGMEYAASGIPFIASRSPEYDLLAEQGVGRVAGNEEEWIQHLTELIDPRIRKEEVEKNYENLKLMHTMEVRGKEWDQVFSSILEK